MRRMIKEHKCAFLENSKKQQELWIVSVIICFHSLAFVCCLFLSLFFFNIVLVVFGVVGGWYYYEIEKSQSNAPRVTTAPNKLISQSETHPDLITAISLHSVNTTLSLHLCILCEWISECSVCEVWVCMAVDCVCMTETGRERHSERFCLINSVVYRQELERVVSWGETAADFQQFNFDYNDSIFSQM